MRLRHAAGKMNETRSVTGDSVTGDAVNEENQIVKQAEKKDNKNKLEKYLCQTLGGDYFFLCKNFFEEIWESHALYKVFIPRRCMNLMYLFYQIRDKKNKEADELLERTFYSDNALLANITEIVLYYRIFQNFPSILLVDDVMIHGRAINTLINQIISEITKYCTAEDSNCDPSEVKEDLLRAIQIRVIVRNERSLLLYGRYQNFMSAEKVWPSYRWRDFSVRVAQVLACGGVANTSFVPSLYECKLRSAKRNNGKGVSLLGNTLNAHGFVRLTTNNRYQRCVWIKFLANRQGHIVNVYTVRDNVGDMNGYDVVTPFLFFADINAEKGHLAERIKELVFPYFDPQTRSAAEMVAQYWRDCPDAWAQMLCFVLCQNLLLLALQDQPTASWKNAIDYDKITMAFHSSFTPAITMLYRLLCKRTEPWFSWEAMDTIVCALTEGAKPLVISELFDSNVLTFSGKHLEEKMVESFGDMLFELEEKAEYHAYRQSLGEEFLTGENNAKIEFCNLLSQSARKTNAFNSDGIAQLVACTLRHMDIGAMTITIARSEDDERERFVCTAHAGEQSMFILPKRYAVYLPVLSAIERDCPGNDEMMYRRIRSFFSAQEMPDIGEELVGFVKRLYQMGQYLFDWEFDLLEWVESEDAYLAKPREKGELAKEPLTVMIRRAKQNILRRAYAEYAKEY